MWSYSEREALCRLKLPKAFTPCKDLCVFSTEGDHVFIAGAAESVSEEEPPDVRSLLSLSISWITHPYCVG